MAFIEIRDVSKAFRTDLKGRPVLERVTLSVERGEFVSIVGMMGSGKSTLLKILAGLLSPDAGEVVIDGLPVTGIRPSAAIVFQNYSLLPWFSALENVRLAVGAAFPDWTRADQLVQARRHLEAVGLGAAINRRPGQLSGGMRQRVAIARAFAIEPQILFLDEPFGALDALTRESLQQELARLCSVADRPVTTVMITNNVEEALLLSDRIVPMVPCAGLSDDDTVAAASTLGPSVDVPLPRPRSAGELVHDEQAARVRGHVVASLSESLRRSHRRKPAVTPAVSASETRVTAAGARDLTYTHAVSEP